VLAKEGYPPSILAYVPCNLAQAFSANKTHISYDFVDAKHGLLPRVGIQSSTKTGVSSPFTQKDSK
jgi:hypothetical protein